MTATPADAPDRRAAAEVAAALALIGRLKPGEAHPNGAACTEAGRAMLAKLGAINPAQSERQEPVAGSEAPQIARDLVLPVLPPAPRRRRIAFKAAAASSMLLHAGTLLALVGWLRHPDSGAIPEPSEAVSVEMVASATLEAMQPKQIAEPAPAPEATAPVEGATEASDAPVAKADPIPEPEVVEPPPPVVVPDVKEEVSRAAKEDEPTEAEAQPEPVESPTPTEVVPEPPKAKVAEDKPPAKAKKRKKVEQKARKREKVERKARKRTRKGGTTSKARRGRGTQSGRASASRGAILRYRNRVRARVFANKPSQCGPRSRVVVAFGVTRSGGLAYARIARASGDPAFARRAVASIRAAAPFPRPPAGAQRRFTIPFECN